MNSKKIPDSVVAELRRRAFSGIWNGDESFESVQYRERCTFYDPANGVSVIYTREEGYHSSGWFKNPQCERCHHISIGFKDPATMEPIDHNHAFANQLVAAILGARNIKKVYIESPVTGQGKSFDIWHYRVWCDANWEPIVPQGEVYSKDLTEAGWKSWSDVQEVINQAQRSIEGRLKSQGWYIP